MHIGLTGGIACGKSTVAGMLVSCGASLIDADAIAREVVEPGSPVLTGIAAQFGGDMLFPDGSLNRKKLGERVFSDSEARKTLEGLTHPRIRALMRERMERKEREEPERLVVVDVPLLYESKLESMFSSVMLVYIPRSLQIERLMRRDSISIEAAELRLLAQMPIETKKEYADIIINNAGSQQETERQVDAFWHALRT